MTFWQLVAHKTIRIPIIQRDYAQGRSDTRVSRVRNTFLQALHEAVVGQKTLLLDFIYGEDKDDSFVPFDGQQRLTTLFLLHWYAAAREARLTDHTVRCLKNFQYEVRDGARLFGQELVERACPQEHPVCQRHDAAKPDALSAYIRDQNWFRPNWIHDPTIMGMLTMLDAIHGQFHDISALWERLVEEENPPVSFFFEQIDNLGSSSEDIFIKMNARGKQLTDFEHFKAQFLDYLDHLDSLNYLGEIAPENVRSIADKLDTQWLEVFWLLFGRDANVEDKAAVADLCFSRYFAYVSDILNGLPWKAEDREAPAPQQGDLFKCVQSALDPGREQFCPKGNLHFLIGSLNKLHELHKNAEENKDGINAFFDAYFTDASPDSLPVQGKITLFGNKSTNLFTRCCEDSLGHVERFMLAGCLLALTTNLEHSVAARRLRILRNILAHSSREFIDAYYADQIRGVYSLVVEGRIELKSRFNTRQLEEEKAKEALRATLATDSELHNALDYLEDHPLLRGRLAVFSQRDHAGTGFHFEKETILQGKHFFELAFGKTAIDYDTVVRGLLSQDDYALQVGETRLYLGSQDSADRQDIFATPDREIFPRVRNAMQSLAAQTAAARGSENLDSMINKIADDWADQQQAKKKMDWRYYFVKYPAMRPDYCETRGYYYRHSRKFEMLQLKKSKRSAPSWSPFLWAAYVEAGLNDNDEENQNPNVKWQACQGTEEKPLLFHFDGISLALWWNESFWRLTNDADPDEPFTPKQRELIKQLRAQSTVLEENEEKGYGYLFIPGEESKPNVDYENTDWWTYHRIHDEVDRIQLIQPVIKALVELQYNYSGK